MSELEMHSRWPKFGAIDQNWYNVAFVFQGIGDTNLGYQCFRLVLSIDNNHAEAYNNLGVLELRKGRIEQARAFFQAAFSLAPQMYEPHYNSAMMSEWVGSQLLYCLDINITWVALMPNYYNTTSDTLQGLIKLSSANALQLMHCITSSLLSEAESMTVCL